MNINELTPWPIDEKHFCHEIVTDFAEKLSREVPIAFGHTFRKRNSVAFYTNEADFFDGEFDVLVEMSWCDNRNSVYIKCDDDIMLDHLAYTYKAWVERSVESDSGAYPYWVDLCDTAAENTIVARLYRVRED